MRQYFYELATDKRNDIVSEFLKVFLWAGSILYGISLKLVLLSYRAGFFRSRQLPKPVISIGNITLGGAGKTPLAALLARLLEEKGLKCAVLSRGYGKTASEDLNDEGVLLREQNALIPVFQDNSRFQAGQKALKSGPVDVFLLDGHKVAVTHGHRRKNGQEKTPFAMPGIKNTEEKAKKLEQSLKLEAEEHQKELMAQVQSNYQKQQEEARQNVLKNASELVKKFIVKTVELKPEAIDEALIQKAVLELKKDEV